MRSNRRARTNAPQRAVPANSATRAALDSRSEGTPGAITEGMFQHGSLTLFRVRGVPIRAHWTLLLILPYLALVLSLQFPWVAQLAGVEGERLGLPPFLWGAILAAALFASVTLHELAHTFVALRYGGRVQSITLMIMGGVSQIVRMPRGAYHEAIMAIAGPATSLALGGVLYAGFAVSGDMPVDLQMGLFYLAAMNLTLGVFNLLPAFPMDGGRILRALLAASIGRERATAIAANVGKAFAVGFGLLGLMGPNFLLLLVAAFIYSGAQAEAAAERMRSSLTGLHVNDLMPARLAPVPAIAGTASLQDALDRMRELDRLELLVLDALGHPIAVIDARDLTVISRRSLPTTVGEFVRLLPTRHVVVDAHATASEALEQAAEAGATYLLVVDMQSDRPHEIIALIAADDLAKSVTLRMFETRLSEAHA